MRKLLIIISILTILTACRTNNGEIGPLYGQWILDKLTVDGEPDTIVCSDYSFSFQNNIIFIVHQLGHNMFSETYGSWTLDGDELTLNFTHIADQHPENGIKFNPPAELRIPQRAATVMDVYELTEKSLRFGFTDSTGYACDYTLYKLR